MLAFSYQDLASQRKLSMTPHQGQNYCCAYIALESIFIRAAISIFQVTFSYDTPSGTKTVATVIQADIEASNGVIHAIDTVLA